MITFRGYRSFLALAIGLTMLLTACSPKKTIVESNLGIKDAPEWVNKGIQFLDDRGGRLFHGVGQAPAMGDASLQESTADTRARAALARIFSSYMNVVSKDYSSAASTETDKINEATVTQQIENLTKLNLSGSKIIARWKDKASGIVYALAEVDLKQAKDTLRAATDMNSGLRDYITTNADNIFDKMAKEAK